MNEYQALQFRRKLSTSLDEVKLILDRQRAQGISAADAAPHRFEDKFLLVNQVTNSLGISIYASLAAVGFSQEKLVTLKQWAQNSSVSFRIVKDSVCTFVKEATRKEESARSVEVEYSLGLLAGKSTSKVVNTITEFFYNYEVSYRIEAFRGMGIKPEDILEITSRTSRMECITRVKSFPFPESTSTSNEVNVSWFIRNLQIDRSSSSVNFDFQINRDDEKRCRTATRNPQVEEAIAAMVSLRGWCQSAHQYFSETVRSAMQRFQNEAYSKLDTNLWSTENVFVPILPIFRDAEAVADEVEDTTAEEALTATTAAASEEVTVAGQKRKRVDPVVDGADIGTLLDGHAASLSRKLTTLTDSYPAPNQLLNNLVSSQEAHLIVILNHIVDIIDMHRQCMDFMEEMLRTQIIAAIGREITPTDFDKYMQFHYRKLYREEFAPRPWSLSVRRTPKHAPEGTVRIEIERSASDGGWQPIDTFSKSWVSDEVPTMTFPISAATTIAFKGSRHVHGYLSHAFQAPRTTASRLQLRLVAAARQFSSFMVVLGRISSATSFDPKHAFIVENKEEMFIPLQGETIPSAKEFRDAIASLSPAQQRFAKAYRAMQLESTLFGVLLIQIKPPMERVLRLHPDSLTKEIKLSQDLSKMFLEYQISSDLMCCEEELADAQGDNALPANRLRQVQENVRRVQEMIEAQIKAEVEEANLARAYQGAPAGDDLFMNMAQPRSAPPMSSSMAFGGAPPMPPPAASAPMMRGFTATRTSATASFASPGAPPPPPSAAAAAPVGGVEGSKAPTTTPQYGAPEPSESDEVAVDVTKYPVALDAAFDELDPHQHAVRPTILHTGATWEFVKQKPLAVSGGSNGTASAAAPPKTLVNEAMQGRHRNKAYDLLDAITRSGGLTLEDCELHVVIAATHAFDRSLMNTLVQANENPIEDVERSSAILASTLHALPPQQLVLPSHGQRLVTMHPQLLLRK